MRSPLLKGAVAISLVLVAGLLVASAYGLYYALTTPAEKEISVPVGNYEQRGQFDYTVHLRPSTLFDVTELGPGQVYFDRLVDDVRMTFSYRLRSDQPLHPQGKEFGYQIGVTLGAGGLWEKSLALIPPTVASDDFTVSFDLPLRQFTALIDTIREETGASSGSPQLTVVARVQPDVQTAHGPIVAPFEQSLAFTFEGGTIKVGEELVKSEPGTLTETAVERVLGLERLRNASGGGVAATLLLLAGLGWLYSRGRVRVRAPEKGLQRAQKKHKELLVRVEALPPVGEGQAVVRVDSLADLFTLAEEIYRPVIYSPDAAGYTYCVIDGLGAVRYERSECSDKEESEDLQEGGDDVE